MLIRKFSVNISHSFLPLFSQFSNEVPPRGASAETEGCRPVDSEILMSLQKDILPPPKSELDLVGDDDDENRYETTAAADLERDIARILEEQALVTRRAGEIEKALAAGQGHGHPLQSPQPSAKVGFAAIQEMARLQERALLGSEEEEEEGEEPRAAAGSKQENIITFDPAANCLQLKPPSTPSKAAVAVGGVGGLGKFPLEVPSSPIARSPPAPAAAPAAGGRVGLRRVGSQR